MGVTGIGAQAPERLASARRAALAVLAIALASPVAGAGDGREAPRVMSVTPVFSQLVVMRVPPGFRGAYQNTRGDAYIQELVPEGEDVEHWTRMITLNGRRNAARNPQASPRALLANIVGGFKQACPGSFAALDLGPQKVDGADGFAAIASCGTVANGADAHSETAVILALRGTADFYTIQSAQRGPPSATALALDAHDWLDRLQALAPIRVFAPPQGERAP